MIVYVDSSVVLRVVLRAAGSLKEWKGIDRFISSALLTVECLRTIHRLHLLEPLADDEFAERVEATEKVLANVELVGLDRIVLERASGSFSLPVKRWTRFTLRPRFSGANAKTPNSQRRRGCRFGLE